MADYQELNYKAQVPLKHTTGRTTTEEIAMYTSIERRLQFEQKQKKKNKIHRQTTSRPTQITRNNTKTTEDIERIYTGPIPALRGSTKLTPTDRQEYAGDTILKLQTRTNKTTLTMLKNNNNVTTGRQIPIQWNKQKYSHREKSTRT